MYVSPCSCFGFWLLCIYAYRPDRRHAIVSNGSNLKLEIDLVVFLIQHWCDVMISNCSVWRVSAKGRLSGKGVWLGILCKFDCSAQVEMGQTCPFKWQQKWQLMQQVDQVRLPSRTHHVTCLSWTGFILFAQDKKREKLAKVICSNRRVSQIVEIWYVYGNMHILHTAQLDWIVEGVTMGWQEAIAKMPEMLLPDNHQQIALLNWFCICIYLSVVFHINIQINIKVRNMKKYSRGICETISRNAWAKYLTSLSSC